MDWFIHELGYWRFEIQTCTCRQWGGLPAESYCRRKANMSLEDWRTKIEWQVQTLLLVRVPFALFHKHEHAEQQQYRNRVDVYATHEEMLLRSIFVQLPIPKRVHPCGHRTFHWRCILSLLRARYRRVLGVSYSVNTTTTYRMALILGVSNAEPDVMVFLR